MILVILSVLIWTPAILGYEALLHSTYNKATGSSLDITETSEPVIGLIIPALIITLVNFFFPINAVISTLVLLVGYVFFIVRLRTQRYKLSWAGLGSGAIWLILVTMMVLRGNKQYDTGLYHLQTIEWIQQSKVVLGLVNLHGRLGYNSVWFSINALVEFPFFHKTGNGYFIGSALILWIFGFSVFRSISRLLKYGPSRYDLFILLSCFLLLLDSQVLPYNASSASPDLPTILFVLLVVHFALRTISGQLDWAYGICINTILAFFAVTLKLSAIPLLLIPVSLAIYAKFHRLELIWKKTAVFSCLSIACLLGPWTLRGILQSGCLVFPASFTCISQIPWTWSIPPGSDLSDSQWIMSWARMPEPGYEPPQVLSNWEWVNPWWERNLHNANTIELILAAWCIGYALWVVAAFMKKPAQARISIAWIAVPLIIGNLYWFFTVPDLRFGIGFLWSLPIVVLQEYMFQLLNVWPQGEIKLRKTFLILVMLGMILGIELFKLSYHDFISSGNTVSELFFKVQQVPENSVQTQKSVDGFAISVPKGSEQCWLSPLPCTPYFRDNLTHFEWQGYQGFKYLR